MPQIQTRFPTFTLTVKDFPPIKEAEITTAPLLVVIGPNNSGKTRLLTLLWGVVRFARQTILRQEPDAAAALQECLRQLRSALKLSEVGSGARQTPQTPQTCLLEGELGASLTRWFNQCLAGSASRLVQELFCESPSAGTLRVSEPQWKSPPVVTLEPLEAGGVAVECGGRRLELYRPVTEWQEKHWFKLARLLCLEWMFGALLPATENDAGLMYLPASRHSLLQALGTFEERARWQEWQELTEMSPRERSLAIWGSVLLRPQSELLALLLSGWEHHPGRFEAIAGLLEEKLLEGQLTRASRGEAGYRYMPRQQPGASLPMSQVSSLVGELAPLALLLRSSVPFTALVLDEPEAHLHLAAQRTLARVLVRLVNAGVPVWCSTHGDTFLQQVNLFIRYGAHTNKVGVEKASEFEPQDQLLLDQVRAVELKPAVGKGSSVQPITLRSEGIPASSFSQEIRAQVALIRRMRELHIDSEDQDASE